MSPHEVRSFREVAIILAHIRGEIGELRKDVEESVSAKKQLIFVCFTSVIGPTVVALANHYVTGK